MAEGGPQPPEFQEEAEDEGGGGGHDAAGGMRWLLTYADMITLLLALFIYLYSISEVSTSKFQSFTRDFKILFGILEKPKPSRPTPIPELSTGENLATQIVAHLASHMSQGLIKVRPRKDEILVYVSDSLLFYEPGEVRVRPEGEVFLKDFAALMRLIRNKVRIEGHTDSTPVKSDRYASNWELSSARALSVLHTLERFGAPSERLRAAAFAHYRPLTPEDEKLGLVENRRVEIAIQRRESP